MQHLNNTREKSKQAEDEVHKWVDSPWNELGSKVP